MPRPTKADLELENEELREKLEAIYEELGDFLEVDETEDEESEA